MPSFVLIPWPETVWSAADRVAGRTPLPLTDAGRARAQTWGHELAGLGLTLICSSDERASIETARIVMSACRAAHSSIPGLAEVDAGLWEGLTTGELTRRYPKIFKRWVDDPSCVCPPEGEDVADAGVRLAESLDRVIRRHSGENIAVILGPLALALVRCLIESVEPARARSMMCDGPLRYQFPGGTDMLPSGLSASRIEGTTEPQTGGSHGAGGTKGRDHAG